MQKKTIPSINLLSTSTQVTFATLPQDIGDLPDQIIKEIQAQGITPQGPMVFEYSNITGDMNAKVDLKIGVPVGQIEYSGAFEITTLDEVEVWEQNFKGRAQDLGPMGWEPFMREIAHAGIRESNLCREVMTDWVGMHSNQNIVEMQMVIV